jgi:hypothetical protein
MKMRTLSSFAVAFLSLTVGAHACVPQVAIDGPEGKRVLLAREGDLILVREEQSSGPARVFRISDFKGLLDRNLKALKTSNLSQDQSALLSKYRLEIPSTQELKKIQDLKTQLRQSWPKPGSPEYEALQRDPQRRAKAEETFMAQLRKLEYEESCVKPKFAMIPEIIEAKNQVSEIVEQLVRDMEGEQLKRVLSYNQDQGSIAYQILKENLNTPQCTEIKTKPSVPEGAACVSKTGGLFQRIVKPHPGWQEAVPPYRIWFDEIQNQIRHEDAQRFCSARGLSLPSKADLEIFKGYFSTGADGCLDDEGRRELFHLFPGLKDRWTWAADLDLDPRKSHLRILFSNNVGHFQELNRHFEFDTYAVQCVLVPPP